MSDPPIETRTYAGDGELADDPRWQKIQVLVSEQKMQAALDVAEELHEAAQAAEDSTSWTRALVEAIKLRMALHGYETAVRTLREGPWPEDALSRAVLSLVYGQSLYNYFQGYSWEIQQRERVAASGEVDLKLWTKDQILEAVQQAYLEVWQLRGPWGERPISDLNRYLNPNNYPPRIRGTLRDAVTYLWVDLLRNSSWWRPEHSNGVYRLDLAGLLARGEDGNPGDTGGTAEAGNTALADPEVHPLAKIVAILGDLEAWHARRKEPEAAFEAYRQRLTVLWDHFSQEEDRGEILASLESALDQLGQDHEWWALGQATRAELLRQLDEPDALIRARAIALEGEAAYPKSLGGQRCRALIAQIEAGSFDLQAMAADGLDRRSLMVGHQNLERLYLRAYRLDAQRRLESSRDYNLLPAHRELQAILGGSKEPAVKWVAQLPATPDYRRHQTFLTPPLKDKGLYLIVASAREDFQEEANQIAAASVFVTDLVLLHRQHPSDGQVTVRPGATGEVLPEVDVTLYRFDYRKGHRKLTTRTTDARGQVTFAQAFNRGHRHFLFAQRGDDTALQANFYQYQENRPAERTNTLIYTDRSIYRPGQKIQWKVVGYRAFAESGRFETLPERKHKVTLMDANGEEVASTEVRANRFGSASGEFEIPAGRLLGSWYLRSSLSGGHRVKVEEYKRPTFEVEIADPEDALRLNRQATLQGEVRYYFGLPVTEGEVTWRVTREPLYPPWWGWYYRSLPGGGNSIQTLAAGDAALEGDGTFKISFVPEADERRADEPGLTYRYRLSVDVTDPGGETRSAERSFRLGFVAVQASIQPDRRFLVAGEAGTVRVQRQDLQGLPRAGEGSLTLLRLVQPEETLLPAQQPLPAPPGADTEDRYATPGDRLRPRWAHQYRPEAVLKSWTSGKSLLKETLRHGDDGTAEAALPPLEPGAYRLRYTTEDAFGAPYETSEEILVAALPPSEGETRETRTAQKNEDRRLALPAILLADRSSAAVGETLRLLVHSGLPDQELVLEVRQGPDDRKSQRRRLRTGLSPRLIEIPIQPRHRGGLAVRLSALRDHQLMTLSESVFVPWDDRKLAVSFETFRDKLRPGQKESWRITLKGADDEVLAGGTAELLAYMYDRSLDLFAPHSPANAASLYPQTGYLQEPQASLGVAQTQWWKREPLSPLPSYPHLHGDTLAAYGGYGIGGLGRRFGEVPTGAARMERQDTFEQSIRVAAESPVSKASAPNELKALGYVNGKEGTGGQDGEPPPPPPSPGESAEPVELRTNFSETAFWEPHLVAGDDGTVSLEFEVPDSVTEWNVWVHALTKDLRSGWLQERTKTVKELLVRPYLPRFLREGDHANLQVVVNNAGDEDFSGRLDFEIFDPESEESLLADFGLDAAKTSNVPFSVEAGGGTELSFPVTAPKRPGQVAFKITARAGSFSDGELRPLPVLPGRLHLAQSRFATLRDAQSQTLRFDDLADPDDPTRTTDQLVVTLDAQLFYSVVNALPYLVSYPYECTEQTLNRFLSTGIASSLYERYPSVAAMAKQLSERETRLETWDDDDPNRKMLLEETPWLVMARGGAETPEDLIKVLDPKIARAQRKSSLARLQKSQTSLGGFPWWPGGPPSPYMTAYILGGFAKALEFEVEIPKEVVVRAWSYLHRHYVDEMIDNMVDDNCCWETVTLVNFVLSSYPDASWTGGVFTDEERRTMLDFSFRHWKQHSPMLKSFLALTLERAGRSQDAALVFDSVMDSAKTDPDLGTYWAPEDRAWLWYNDTIETHAWALRTLAELDPTDERRHGLVHWLFLNKKLNHWKSTRATAEVIYSLAHYLEQEDALAVREAATVTVGPSLETPRTQAFVWEPDTYTGKKNQVVIPGGEVVPAMGEIEIAKDTPGFLFASATWHFATDELPEEAEGDFFGVTRKYFRRVNDGREWLLEPLEDGAELAVGDQLEVQLSLTAKHAAEYVHLRDPRGAGFEPESATSGYRWDLGIATYEEIRDSGANFFLERLPAGQYTFKYRVRANLAGTFRVGPATVQSMYAPEFTAYSSGTLLTVQEP